MATKTILAAAAAVLVIFSSTISSILADEKPSPDLYHKTLANGDMLALEYSETQRYTDEKERKNYPADVQISIGWHRVAFCSLSLTTKENGRKQVVWQSACHPKPSWKNATQEDINQWAQELPKILDVRQNSKSFEIACVDLNILLVVTSTQQNDGEWKTTSEHKITRQSEATGRYVKNAVLLGDNKVQVELINRDIEIWSYAGERAELIQKIPYNSNKKQ